MKIDSSWSVFLDRDGVINKKLENDYVKSWDAFKFIDGSLDAIAGLSKIFGHVFIVTNQRGVGLGLMAEQALQSIHERMLEEIDKHSGRIDKVYYCVESSNSAECRKPNIGMGLLAKHDFPGIEFSKSIIVGDSISDMEFGKNLGMKTVYISAVDSTLTEQQNELVDFKFCSLYKYFDHCKCTISD